MPSVRQFRFRSATAQTGYHQNPRDLDGEDMTVMHLPVRYWESRIVDIPKVSQLRSVVEKFETRVVDVLENRNPSLFLFHGPSGSGKTAAAAIMGKIARAHKYTVFFVDCPRINDLFRDEGLTADEVNTHEGRAYSTDVLILDGLGEGSNAANQYTCADIEALIRHRQAHMKLTIVTTNVSSDTLVRLYGAAMVRLLGETSVSVRTLSDARSAPLKGLEE